MMVTLNNSLSQKKKKVQNWAGCIAGSKTLLAGQNGAFECCTFLTKKKKRMLYF